MSNPQDPIATGTIADSHTALRMEIDRLRKELNDRTAERDVIGLENMTLRRQVYMPSTWKCDACGFELNRITLNPDTGEFGSPAIQEIPICPNKDGQPMRPVTWEGCAASNYKACQQFLDERDSARHDLANAKAAAVLVKENVRHWRENCGKLDSRLKEALAQIEENGKEIAKLRADLATAVKFGKEQAKCEQIRAALTAFVESQFIQASCAMSYKGTSHIALLKTGREALAIE